MDPLRILKNELSKNKDIDSIKCPVCNYSIKMKSVNAHIKRCKTHDILLTNYYKNNVPQLYIWTNTPK
jgi:uncharacterized protein (DUF2225 family)